MEIVFVVAIAENGVIGAGNAMPWRMKSDMARFKALTIGNIVITRDADYRAAGAIVTRSAADAGAIALGDALRRSVAEIAVIGGAEIFRQWLDRADRLEITEVHARPEGDTHFEIDRAEWDEVERIRHPAGPHDSADYSYVTYRRRVGH
jgi:dihydrofolate reductase